MPEGEDENSWFVKEVEKGLRFRYPDGIPDEVRTQADFEVEVITRMGFPGYFLVVADFINWAKDNGIRVGPGRGSGAGSMCAYAMRITDLDPLKHGLIFERFLNPDRVSMPDFDIDFDERRRGEVIRYVSDKYGDDRVSMIVTYGTIKAKQAVKDSSRILGYPFAMGDRITKAMPAAVMGKDVPLKEIFDPEHKRFNEGGEFRQLYDGDNDVKTVVDTAIGIEGLKRQWGVHAAGVIMSSEPLLDVIPVMRRPADGAVITQFDYPTCEKLGLIKMDFLGLRNLTVLDDALINIESNRGEKVVLEDLELTDEATYKLLQRGDTLGVFQLDGGPMRALLRSMQPDTFEDISAVGALYRPGPMGADSHNKYARRKTGREQVEPLHPELAEALEEVLGETYGLIVYQEQVMAIAQQLAGYTLGQADLLRRAMGKKKKEELDKQFETFSGGMTERGFSVRGDQGAVGHAAAVLRLRVQQGPLGGLRPGVLLDRLPQGQLPGRVHGRAPHLGEGRQGQDGDLPQRVSPHEDPGAAARRQRVAGQLHPGRHGHPVRPDRDPQRRLERRRADHLHPARAGPVHRLRRLHGQGPGAGVQQAADRVADQGRRLRRDEARPPRAAGRPRAGRRPVRRHQAQRGHRAGLPLRRDGRATTAASGSASSCPTSRSGTSMTLLGHEREMLGLYVSDHPLTGLEHVLASAADCTIGQLLTDEDRSDGAPATICGLITAVTRKITKTGNAWAIVTVEDLEGAIDVLLFPSDYQLASTLLVEDTVVTVQGRLDKSKDQPELRGKSVSTPVMEDRGVGPVLITLPSTRCTPPVVEQLKEVLRTHPGTTEVRLRLVTRGATRVLRLDDRLRVSASPALYGDLKHLLGPGCLG